MTTTSNARPEIGRDIRAAGLRTNCHVVGTGAPVVLVHGSGPGVTAHANWRSTIPALASRFTVIAPDMAGFGHSEHPGDIRCDLDLWVRQLLGVLDTLEIPRVSIVGNSFGGAIALRMATRHPERVDKLVLMGSTGISFPITQGLDAVWGYEPSFEAMRRVMDLFAFDRSLVTDELAQLRFRASDRPEVRRSYGRLFPAPRQRWIEATATPEDDIRGITSETLIVHGRDDRVVPVDNALRLHELIGPSQLHVFGRCGHWTQIERSTTFNRLVADFLLGERAS